MKRVFFVLVLLATVLLALSTSYSQSGRNRSGSADAKTEKRSSGTTQAKPETETEEDLGVSESRVGAEGETVEDDVIRVNTSLVTVPVTVLDRNGRYVPYLRRQDFRLYEDGVEQKIAYFATVNQPFTVVLLLDTSGSTEFRIDDIQNAAITFVSKLRADDSVMVMAFDDSIDVLCRATTDRAVITRAIRRANGGGGTRLYDAVDDVLKKQLKTITGRKAVVLFTDGVDTTSRRASYASTIREAEESDAPIYTVDYASGGVSNIMSGQGIPGSRGGIIFGIPIPRPGSPGGGGAGGSGTSAEDYRYGAKYLQALSDRTGGRFHNADTLMGIGQAFALIAEELGRQYSLGYYPKVIAREGERRQIKVRAVEPEMIVKARGSYIPVTKKAEPASSEPPKEQKPWALRAER